MPENAQQVEARAYPRLKLAAMYTLVRVRPAGDKRYKWTGYAYDISMSGMRFELDEPLAPGTEIEVRAMLPGLDQITMRAAGRVVRLVHDQDDEAGPIRMAMTFDQFATSRDDQRLSEYLGHRGLAA